MKIPELTPLSEMDHYIGELQRVPDRMLDIRAGIANTDRDMFLAMDEGVSMLEISIEDMLDSSWPDWASHVWVVKHGQR